ncbi:MAG: hypothetical protein ABL958_14820 [Bdellovibrionia bacterium]
MKPLLIFFCLALSGCSACPYLGFNNKGQVSCNVDKDNKPPATETTQVACPDPNDVSINGIRNDFATTLSSGGGWQSQIHFKTAGSYGGFYRLTWSAGTNRQTCTTGHVSENGFNSYLAISSSPTAMAMKVVPGLNYFDYIAHGCRTAAEKTCTEVVESGTAVLSVNYIP